MVRPHLRACRTRVATAATALVALAILLCVGAPSFAQQGARATTLTLSAQSGIVASGGTFSLRLLVTASQPSDQLDVRLTVYSALSNRTAYSVTLNNGELPTESCLEQVGPIPVPGPTVPGSGTTTVAVREPVTTSATAGPCEHSDRGIVLTCQAGACAGVYPVQVALVDTADGRELASFTTHLVYVPKDRGLSPLEVATVLSIGGAPAIAPDGRSLLTGSEISSLEQLISVLAAYPRVQISLVVYPQYLLGLSRAGAAGATALARLRTFVVAGHHDGDLRLIGAPFTPLDASSLASAELTPAFAQAEQRADAIDRQYFGFAPSVAIYNSPTALDAAGVTLLERACVREFVTPEAGLEANRSGLTQTAPFIVEPTASCEPAAHAGVTSTAVAAQADPAGELFSKGHSTPVLSAHQILDELAQVYFEQPNATPRGVVIAPPSGTVEPSMLRVFLEGLSSNPLLRPTTLSGLFNDVPAGSNGNDAQEIFEPATVALGPSASELRTMAALAAAVTSIVPKDAALDQTMRDSRLIALEPDLEDRQRTEYLNEPLAALDALSSSLSLSGASTVTLTQQTGEIPITIDCATAAPGYPVDVRLELRSQKLDLDSRARLTLTSKDTPEHVEVRTRSAGEFPLDIALVSPVGAYPLLENTFTVRSTAVSGVGIGLSVAAVAVLLAWWLRSILRRRHSPKTRHRRHSAPA